jgi:ligand-binding sensor domain-containing protein
MAQHYNIVKFGVREGLLHSLVTGISQDKRGEIWMSTGGGLCHFNGVEFNYLTTKEGLNFTRLTCVAADDDNNIWVGSSKGINFICGKIIQSVSDSLINGEIVAISPAGGSKVWVVTNNGLYKLQYLKGNFSVYQIKITSFQSSIIPQIFQDRVLSNFVFTTHKGVVFFVNNGTLFKITSNNIEEINVPEGVIVNVGKETTWWRCYLGTNKGLYKLINSEIISLNHTIANNIDIKDFCVDGSKIWILGKEIDVDKSEVNLYALDLINQNYFHRIGKANGLTDEPSQIFLDHEFNLWAISNNGVFLLKGNAFTAFTVADGLVGNKVWGVNRSVDGVLWVGTIGEGLSVIKDNKIYNYNKSKGLPDNYVGRIYQTKNGNVYIGTSNSGVCRVFYSTNLNSIRFERLPLLSSAKLRVDDILEDKDGTLWVASNKGLYFTKDQKNFTRLPLQKLDTGQVFVQKLLLDTIRNEIWIGTRNNGVFVLKNGVVKRFEQIDTDEEISSLVMDDSRNVWIGTRSDGVFRWDYSHLLQFSEKDGLISNLIYILYPDTRNNLWIGSNLGLDRLDLNALNNAIRISLGIMDLTRV